MGNFIDAFPEPLKSRLLNYAEKYGDGEDSASVDDIRNYALPLDNEQWDKVRGVMGWAEVYSLTDDYEATSKTKEVKEVIRCFLNLCPYPES